MDLRLTDKIALVTGSSRGIGRAIAIGLAAEGCKLGLCARGRPELDQTLSEISSLGVDAFGTTADVTQPGDTERFIEEAAAALGGVDILINNVGGSSGAGLAQSNDSDWSTTFDLNLFHAVRATRAALPYLRAQGGGTVLIISSISGWKPAPTGAQYGCAKAAEMYLGSALALELAVDNVRVNTICPGSILFPDGGWDRTLQTDPQGFGDFVSREFPKGRLGKAEEIADAAIYLVSERANWINGTSIPVDGAQGRPSMF